jgi:hypothetical protein
MKTNFFLVGTFVALLGGSIFAQTGLPVWPLVVPGNGNNDVLVDFVHSGTPTSNTIPNTGTNMTPAGTGVAIDSCGYMQLYFISNTTSYPANGIASMSTYQENMQQLKVYDKNGNNLPLYDPTWSNTSVPNMNSVAADREIQVIPRQGYGNQWFIIYNEPHQLQASDLNNGSYGYTNTSFQTGYRPSYIKYSLIEYDETNNRVRRVNSDAYLTANGNQYTYMHGKVTDIPVSGNYDLFTVQLNQLTSTSGSWTNQSNVQLHKFQINSSAGTISYVTGSAITNAYIDGYVVAASSLELGAAYTYQIAPIYGNLRSENTQTTVMSGGAVQTATVSQGVYATNDYRLALNMRNASGYPDLMLFPHNNFSNPARIIELSTQRIQNSNALANTLQFGSSSSGTGDGFSNKIGALEWDPTGQYLYLTSSNGNDCLQIGDAFLFQLNVANYQSTTGTYNVNASYGINFQNQDLCGATINGTTRTYVIGDLERGYNNKLYFSKFDYSSPTYQSSGTLYGINLGINASAFQNYTTVSPPPTGHDIDFGSAYDIQVVQPNAGNIGICLFPDGIDGYDYSRGQNSFAPPNPAFTLTAIGSSSSPNFTVSATTPPLPSGAYFAWDVQQITSPGGTIIPGTDLSNPSQWWYSTDVPTTYFEGYCVPSCPGTNASNMGGPWSSSAYASNHYGTFTKGNYYRITRGLWTNCIPWVSSSMVVYVCSSCKSENGEDVFIIEPDNSYHPSRPDNLEMSSAIQAGNQTADIQESIHAELYVNPNPSNGIVSIHINPGQLIDGNINISIQNIMGQVVEQKTLVNGQLDASFQLESQSKGMYVIKVQYGNTMLSKKLILE